MDLDPRDEEIGALLAEVTQLALDYAGGDAEEAARILRFYYLGIMPWGPDDLADPPGGPA